MLSAVKRKQATRMITEGTPIVEVAQALGVSRSTHAASDVLESHLAETQSGCGHEPVAGWSGSAEDRRRCPRCVSCLRG